MTALITEAEKPTKNITEVLIVIDEESMHYSTPSFAYHESFIKDFASNIKMCGAPVTLIRKKDLYDMDLKQFKVVFFLNCFKSDDKFEHIVHNGFNKGTVFVWNYAAGFVKDTCDFKNTCSLTSFVINDYDGSDISIPNTDDIDFPLICISEETDVRVLRRYNDGKVIIGEKTDMYGNTNILCSLPLLTLDEIYEIIKNSGAYMPAVKNCTVYGNNKFIAFFANDDVNFEFTSSGSVKSAFNKNISGFSIDIALKKGQSEFLILE